VRVASLRSDTVPAKGGAAVEHLQEFAAFLLVVIERSGKVRSQPRGADRCAAVNSQGRRVGAASCCPWRGARGVYGLGLLSRQRRGRQSRRSGQEFPSAHHCIRFADLASIFRIAWGGHGGLLLAGLRKPAAERTVGVPSAST